VRVLEVHALPRSLYKSSGRMLPVAKFIVQDWEAIADFGIGSSYRPSRLHKLKGRYDNPMPESTISLQSGTKNWASLLSHVAPPFVNYFIQLHYKLNKYFCYLQYTINMSKGCSY
jgi:hypothetical protein